jgi:hypothetical protein
LNKGAGAIVVVNDFELVFAVENSGEQQMANPAKFFVFVKGEHCWFKVMTLPLGGLILMLMRLFTFMSPVKEVIKGFHCG